MTKALATIELEINPVLLQASELNISDATTMATASSLRERIKTTIDIVEEVKEKYFRPKKIELDLVSDKYNPVIKKLTDNVKDLDKRMSTCQTALIAKQKEEVVAIVDRVAPGSGNFSPETAMKKMAELDSAPVLAETRFISKQELEIYNFALIPNMYLLPNEPMIKEALKRGQEIPGARFIEKFVPRSK